MGARLIGILLVLCSTCFEAGGQLSLKTSALSHGTKKWLVIGIICFALETVVWTFVLKRLDVSIAFPMSSMSFVVIALASQLILKEEVTAKRWAGVCFILCGTAMVGLS